ncbi:serine protease [Glutamicibacter sp. MNS18]|uniref:P-loop NTPase n=1 Tax=Glutamicibacter sp. MNS18 TaxID=2989817 RepID=UPI002236BA23|nr:S1C family serine protease [Glutamicibacter sp. MNS18]MCW4466128.1 serine protease [Glutamicibacter sp. MNS18]
MAIDSRRVAAVYARGKEGNIGSAYFVSNGVALTAAHVLSDAGLEVNDKVVVLPSDGIDWLMATVVWLGQDPYLDAALLSLDDPTQWEVASNSLWGKLPGSDPVAVQSAGFPSSVTQNDGRLSRENLIGFVTPPVDSVNGCIDLHVASSTPVNSRGESLWAGMSGAALIAGPCIIGIVIKVRSKFGTDRLQALSVEHMVESESFLSALGYRPELSEIGSDWRLQYGSHADKSLVLCNPNQLLPDSYNIARDPYRLLRPDHRQVDFLFRHDLVADIKQWVLESKENLAIKTITGAGGSGKTRLAIEACLAAADDGWDAGFADFQSPGGNVRYHLESPTLIVIDEADLLASQIAAIVKTTRNSKTPIRLLLVARSRTTWWETLHSLSGDNLLGYDQGEISLDNFPMSKGDCAELFRISLQRFSNRLSVTLPANVNLNFYEEDLTDPLIVQIAAMIAILDDTANVDHKGAELWRTKIMRRAVQNEANRWVQMHEMHHTNWNEKVLRRCVSTATLVSPSSNAMSGVTELEKSAIRFLRTITDLNDATNHQILSLSDWLHTLHSGPAYWNPLRPGQLADQLLADLTILPELAETIYKVAMDRRDANSAKTLIHAITRAAGSSQGCAQYAMERIFRLMGKAS